MLNKLFKITDHNVYFENNMKIYKIDTNMEYENYQVAEELNWKSSDDLNKMYILDDDDNIENDSMLLLKKTDYNKY